MSGELKTVLRRNLSHALRHGDLPQAAALLDRLKLEDPLALETRGLELEFLLRAGRLAEGGAIIVASAFPGRQREHGAGANLVWLCTLPPPPPRFYVYKNTVTTD